MESLLEAALNANKLHKSALSTYIDDLQQQLAEADLLIKGAESHLDVPDDMNSDEELPKEIYVPNALAASAPLPIAEVESLNSPFYEECQPRIRYNELTTPRNWTDAERASLRDAVLREGMRMHAYQLQTQGFNAIAALKDVPLENYMEIKQGLDWDRISLQVPSRLPSACKVQWLANDHPGVQRGPWTDRDIKELHRAVEESRRAAVDNGQGGEHPIDWEIVAGLLGTGRVPVDCLKAYRANTSKATIVKWTPALDKELFDAVARFGVSNMTSVALSMSIPLSRKQCLTHYQTLTQVTKRGSWTVQEDAKLRQAVEEIPAETRRRWILIAERMEGRTQKQCRERWASVLDTSVKRGDWTDDEDRILREALVGNEKPDYPAIAKQLNRLTSMVKARMDAFARGANPHKKRLKPRAQRQDTEMPGTPESTMPYKLMEAEFEDEEEDYLDSSTSGSEFEEEETVRTARARRLAQQRSANSPGQSESGLEIAKEAARTTRSTTTKRKRSQEPDN